MHATEEVVKLRKLEMNDPPIPQRVEDRLREAELLFQVHSSDLESS